MTGSRPQNHSLQWTLPARGFRFIINYPGRELAAVSPLVSIASVCSFLGTSNPIVSAGMWQSDGQSECQ